MAYTNKASNHITPPAPESLQILQSDFKAYLLDDDSTIETHIVSSTEDERETRLQIYQNAYYLRLLDALKEDYEILYNHLGEDEFTHLALAYIRTYPSTFPSLRNFGYLFTDYIKQSKHFVEREYIAELAKLQWLIIEAFDAADHAVIDESTIAGVPPQNWPNLTLQFTPSVRCFICHWNTVDIYSSLKKQLPSPQAKRLLQPSSVLVWRHQLVTHYRILDASEGDLITSAMQGANFSELCDQLNTDDSDDQENALHAVGLLKLWLHYGIIADVNYS